MVDRIFLSLTKVRAYYCHGWCGDVLKGYPQERKVMRRSSIMHNAWCRSLTHTHTHITRVKPGVVLAWRVLFSPQQLWVAVSWTAASVTGMIHCRFLYAFPSQFDYETWLWSFRVTQRRKDKVHSTGHLPKGPSYSCTLIGVPVSRGKDMLIIFFLVVADFFSFQWVPTLLVSNLCYLFGSCCKVLISFFVWIFLYNRQGTFFVVLMNINYIVAAPRKIV